MFRSNCFYDIGGYQKVKYPDVVANAKAKIRGWSCMVFEGTSVNHLRPVNSFDRNQKGVNYLFRKMGETDYYLGYSVKLAILKSINHSITKIPPRPFSAGFTYLVGYFISILSKANKINDDDVLRYYSIIYPKTIIKFYFKKIKRIFERV